MNTNNTNEQYRENALGHLVPLSSIRAIDLLRDDSVMRIVTEAHNLRRLTQESKKRMYADIRTFLQLSYERFDVKWGGRKGNVTLKSFDGKYTVKLAVDTRMGFNEGLQIAKEKVDECIIRWSKGSDEKIKALVMQAFQTDKQGQINTARVLELTRLNIEDADWKLAMDAIIDSMEPAGTVQYIIVSERIGKTQRYRQIPLDFSALPMGDE
jgi:hypothetical protein